MPVKVTIKGEDNLNHTLLAFQVACGRLPASHQANLVVTTAKRLCPVRTGRLRNSIGSTSGSQGGAIVFAAAPYAVYVHDGTRYMRPRPFLVQALLSEQQAIVAVYSEQVNAELAKVKGA